MPSSGASQPTSITPTAPAHPLLTNRLQLSHVFLQLAMRVHLFLSSFSSVNHKCLLQLLSLPILFSNISFLKPSQLQRTATHKMEKLRFSHSFFSKRISILYLLNPLFHSLFFFPSNLSTLNKLVVKLQRFSLSLWLKLQKQQMQKLKKTSKIMISGVFKSKKKGGGKREILEV